jgi:hypothetical protein
MAWATATYPTYVVVSRSKLGCVWGAWRWAHAVSEESVELMACRIQALSRCDSYIVVFRRICSLRRQPSKGGTVDAIMGSRPSLRPSPCHDSSCTHVLLEMIQLVRVFMLHKFCCIIIFDLSA